MRCARCEDWILLNTLGRVTKDKAAQWHPENPLRVCLLHWAGKIISARTPAARLMVWMWRGLGSAGLAIAAQLTWFTGE